MGAVVATVDGHVDREVTDQPDPTPAAYARSACHSRSNRTCSARAPPPAKATQSSIQYAFAPRSARSRTRDDRRVRIAEQTRPARERRCRRIGRAELVGWIEREDLPPTGARGGQPVDERERLGPEPAARK